VKLKAIQILVFLLPPQNVQVLYVLLDLMNKVAAHSELNQMSSSNLATCIGPNMLRKDLKTTKSTDNRSSGISPVLLAAAQQSAASRGAPGARKSSIFSFAPGASLENLKPVGSKDSLSEKETKSMLALNAKIVVVVEFMISRFDEIWEVSAETNRYT
jgi:hypothetical protein